MTSDKWISVSERKPFDARPHLVIYKEMTGHYFASVATWHPDQTNCDPYWCLGFVDTLGPQSIPFEITHWYEGFAGPVGIELWGPR